MNEELDYEYANEETDKQLDETEKELVILYTILLATLLKSAKKYLGKHDKQDSKMLLKLEKGEDPKPTLPGKSGVIEYLILNFDERVLNLLHEGVSSVHNR